MEGMQGEEDMITHSIAHDAALPHACWYAMEDPFVSVGGGWDVVDVDYELNELDKVRRGLG